MRKIACLIIAVMLCMSIAAPAFATESALFVPSISYKDGPGIEDAIMVINGEEQGVDECVVVTTVLQANEKNTDITQEDRDLLLEVYEALNDGSMNLPLEGDYVIRELLDLSFEYEDCRAIEDHGHKDVHLKDKGVTLSVTFDLNLNAADEITVLTYVDGEWVFVEKTENNGDGTLTCVFEDICPVAFVTGGQKSSAPAAEAANNQNIGGSGSSHAGSDDSGVGIWATTGICGMAAIAVVASFMIRGKKKENA